MTRPHSSSNQATTEPIPPSPGHDVPGAGAGADSDSGSGSGDGARPDAGEGTSDGPGPRVGSEDVRVTAIARNGLADGETDNRTPPTTTF